ncbi:MAG: molybdopterin synthase sulfur carrier subunit [Sandaracinus sp.]|nr:molybdopterin synthase sulfur carrier subunit [Sandaracinus sp.]
MAAITVRIPPALRSLTAGSDEVSLDATTVRDAVEKLEAAHPGVRERILGPEGKVLRFVNLFVEEDDIRMLDGLDTELRDRDALSIIPAIAGG